MNEDKLVVTRIRRSTRDAVDWVVDEIKDELGYEITKASFIDKAVREKIERDHPKLLTQSKHKGKK